MIIAKYITLIGIMIISSYLGIIKAKTFEDRVCSLNEFQNSLVMFKSKIEFTYEPIKDIFEEISKIIYQDKENIFLNTIKNKKDIYRSWCEAVDYENKLWKEDKEIIKMMGKLLGKTDLKGQVSQINLSLNLIDKQIEKAEIEKNRNVKLYRTMGIIFGMGICIILI
jgi:stage III sporulation protein AB